MIENNSVDGLNFVIPPLGSERYTALRSVLARVIVDFASPEEVTSLIESPFTLNQHTDPAEPRVRQIENLIKLGEDREWLHRVVSRLRQLRPAIWDEQIWPLVRPLSYLPPGNDAFVGRIEERIAVQDLLLNFQGQAVVLRGVNGIGKTALALEVAYTCRQEGKFKEILWVSAKSGKLEYLGKVYDWLGWLRDLNRDLEWEIVPPAEGDEHVEGFERKCKDRLRSGTYLLCVDGLDEVKGNENFLEFLRYVPEGACNVLVTTQRNLDIPAKRESRINPWKDEDAHQWIHETGAQLRIDRFAKAGAKELQALREQTGFIPLALVWRVHQLATHLPEGKMGTHDLRSLSEVKLLEAIFLDSFSHLTPHARKMLLVLSLFDFAATRDSVWGVAGLNEAEFKTASEELLGLSLIIVDDGQRLSLLPITRRFVKAHFNDDTSVAQAVTTSWQEYYRNFALAHGGRNRRKYAPLRDDWANLWQFVMHAMAEWEKADQEVTLTPAVSKYGLLLIDLANSLRDYLRIHGLWNEDLELCQLAAQAASRLRRPADLGHLAYEVGWAWCNRGNRGDLQKARGWGNWAWHTLEAMGQGSGYALRLLARIERDAAGDKVRENCDKITSYLERARQAFEQDHDQFNLIRLISDQARLAFRCGDYPQAVELYHRILSRSDVNLDDELHAHTLANLGNALRKQGEFDKALTKFREAVKVAGLADNIEVITEAQIGIANAMLDMIPTMPSSSRPDHIEVVRQTAQPALSSAARLGHGLFKQATDAIERADVLAQMSDELIDKIAEQHDKQGEPMPPQKKLEPKISLPPEPPEEPSVKPEKAGPMEVFFAYSHRDEDLLSEVEKQLSILMRQGVISTWHDRKIGAGTEWEDQIDSHLDSAHIILLLVSADFLVSDYCYNKEMTRALERHEKREARVIPVILRPCDWNGAPFAKLQALPKDGNPVTTWPNRDEAFTDIAKGIRKAAGELSRQP